MGVINMVTIAAIFAEMFLNVRGRAAVPGSHERFVALSFRRIASWCVIVLFALQGVLALSTGNSTDSVWGLIDIGVAIWLARSELRNHHNDDDWFNGRGKKILTGIRTAFTPRAARIPSFA
jgi:hypothetical protein